MKGTTYQRINTFYANYLKEPLVRLKIHPLISKGAFYLNKIQSRQLRTFSTSDTELTFFCEGIGERMIMKQAGPAFKRVAKELEPDFDRLVISAGASPLAMNPSAGDINAYWWWSMGRRPDFLEHYLENVTVTPDVILCPSNQTREAAEAAGFETVYLPLAVGPQFRPLDRDRTGLGYAGGKNYDDTNQQHAVLGPVKDRDDFEWVNDKDTAEALNEWYNSRLITFGMTRPHQEKMGMVNNRVFETLGSGTPLILHDHRSVEDVLGFEYPYQTSSQEQTEELVENIQSNPAEHLDQFEEYSERIHENHSYEERFRTLLTSLSTQDY